MYESADLILLSDCIFIACADDPFSGYIAIKDDLICDIGKTPVPEKLIDEKTRIISLGNRTVTPGFIDVHCFFSGYVIRFLGVDLADFNDESALLACLKEYAKGINDDQPLFGHDLSFTISEKVLDEHFKDRPVVLFNKGCETCSMNTAAMDAFNFTSETCYPEAYVAIFPYVLGDREFIQTQFIEYMKMMNSHGVTSIKEMGFDDFYGFSDTLARLQKQDSLTLRVNFMSQPVAKDIDLSYGEKMREMFKAEKVSFSGYNQMTDGSISEYNALLKEPYNNTDSCCNMKIDWDKLGNDVRKADQLGFRFSLHTQGDQAIAEALNIYETCRKDQDGKVVLNHALTDLEFSDPQDLERMGRLGVIAEIYPQIQSIANRKDKLAMIEEKIGKERGRYYWNRRKMADSGVVISCGTDLPLLIDDIPESVYHAVGGYFPEGGEPFNKENMLKLPELLRAWTFGGAVNLGKQDRLGTLEVGKKADIAILSGNIFETAVEDVRKLKVFMTIFDGKIVYKEEKNG